MATLWLLRDGELTADKTPAAQGPLGDLTHLRVKDGAVHIGPATSALRRVRHAGLLLDSHEGDLCPGYYAGRYAAAE